MLAAVIRVSLGAIMTLVRRWAEEVGVFCLFVGEFLCISFLQPKM